MSLHTTAALLHRLVDDGDRSWFCGLLARQMEGHLGIPFADAFPAGAPPSPRRGGGSGAVADGAPEAAALRQVLYAPFVKAPPGVEVSGSVVVALGAWCLLLCAM